jgi:hypothetical protein
MALLEDEMYLAGVADYAFCFLTVSFSFVSAFREPDMRNFARFSGQSTGRTEGDWLQCRA